jgi:hypothetical protein
LKEMFANYGRQLEIRVSSLVKVSAKVLPEEKAFQLGRPLSVVGIIAHLR